MINWNKLKVDDVVAVSKIVKRTLKLIPGIDRHGLQMDIEACHITNPMKLSEWLKADDNNFLHDIYGITANINRENGNLENCFWPRFAQKQ